MTRVYLAMSFTGRRAEAISKEMKKAKAIFSKHKLDLISAWDRERGYYEDDEIVGKGLEKDILRILWIQDKFDIERSQVVCAVHTRKFSKGAACEAAFNRYALMRPTVWCDTGYESVRMLEDDAVFDTLEECARHIDKHWGTWYKRVWWRLTHIYTPKVVWKRVKRFIAGWR